MLEQTLQRFHFDQRYIAVEDQYGIGGDERHGLRSGVPGAELFVLQYEIQVVRGQAFAHRIGTVADHHVDTLWLQLTGTVDNVAQHGVAGYRVQHLGQGRTHASALACSENDDFKRHEWLPILRGPSSDQRCFVQKKKKGSRGYPF